MKVAKRERERRESGNKKNTVVLSCNSIYVGLGLLQHTFLFFSFFLSFFFRRAFVLFPFFSLAPLFFLLNVFKGCFDHSLDVFFCFGVFFSPFFLFSSAFCRAAHLSYPFCVFQKKLFEPNALLLCKFLSLISPRCLCRQHCHARLDRFHEQNQQNKMNKRAYGALAV